MGHIPLGGIEFLRARILTSRGKTIERVTDQKGRTRPLKLAKRRFNEGNYVLPRSKGRREQSYYRKRGIGS